jgi:hypothetical protein
MAVGLALGDMKCISELSAAALWNYGGFGILSDVLLGNDLCYIVEMFGNL